ncbi:hypothetical protein RUMCAL_00197 [Ruminococcus callidus ATCC 27760]|jgi:hypothetical protein|uniref:Uncharacterized protein n=2 Tax=Ruminococcus callidus TaxID=40519 RepID=U2M6P2_9FIRM|nr:hypothetical protein RUMCAL_00197 [Ruminococcus callidus ATCC 27760]
MRKVIKRTVFSLTIIFIIIMVSIKSCTRDIYSMSQLEEILPINLCSNEVELKGNFVEDYVVETRLVLFYEITDSEFQNRDYYQYKIDYNPLPSYDKDNKYKEEIKDYLLKFNLNSEEITYVNFVFSQYQGIEYEIRIYVFLKNNDESVYRIVLLTDIPSRLNVQF